MHTQARVALAFFVVWPVSQIYAQDAPNTSSLKLVTGSVPSLTDCGRIVNPTRDFGRSAIDSYLKTIPEAPEIQLGPGLKGIAKGVFAQSGSTSSGTISDFGRAKVVVPPATLPHEVLKADSKVFPKMGGGNSPSQPAKPLAPTESPSWGAPFVKNGAPLDRDSDINPCDSSAEPQTIEAVFLVKRRRELETRNNDPEIIRTTENAKQFEKNKGSILIGGAVVSHHCVQAIRVLKNVGLADSKVAPWSMLSKDQRNAENGFSQTCLSAAPSRVERDVGLLSIANTLYCTGRLISKRLVLTARHCFFKELNQVTRTISMLSGASLMRWQFWTSTGISSYQPVRVHLPIGDGVKRWVAFSVEQGGKPSIKNLSEEQWRRDFALVELDRDAHQPDELIADAPKVGEQLIPVTAYPSTWGQRQSDSSPLRTQVAGACKVLDVNKNNGCMVHACSVTGGASGAPMFVKRPVGDTHRYIYVGMHTSGTADGTGCGTEDWGSGTNTALSSEIVFSSPYTEVER